jgi:uncharacterized protein (TIGR02646 family)
VAAAGREEGLADVIPIQPQPEPADFDSKVRKKGRAALRKHKPRPPVPSDFWKGKDHWTALLVDLREAYSGLCAFMAIRIERVTGAKSVEHFKPKSKYPDLAYEWDNFRLVCGLLNGRKGNYEDVLDPFKLTQPVFGLEPLSGEIFVRGDCPAKLRAKAESTLTRLRLDSDPECRKVRREHAQRILRGDWSKDEGQAASPFVFQALVDAGLL